MSDTKICPACHGNGYVPDGDGERNYYRDCEVCDSQGDIPKEETTDGFVQEMPPRNCF